MSDEVAFAVCPACGKIVMPERTHNGFGYVWHFVHCGWGHETGVMTFADAVAYAERVRCELNADAVGSGPLAGTVGVSIGAGDRQEQR